MFKRLVASLVCLTFSLSNFQYVHAQDFSVNQLPVPGAMIGESAPFSPLALKGLIVNPQKPLEFQFIVDTGKGLQDTASIKEEANQLVKYFLAGLTIPEGDLWVNLSPYEKNRMVPEALGQTDLGRDLLAQDYILKQLTASLIYPEKDLGKEFWSRVYAKAQKQFGTTNVPVNTFNKVWILPDQAQVFENGAAAYVTQATLKVMLDEDYLALSRHVISSSYSHSVASQIVRQIILPEIKKEVNTGKNFARLRQIYDAMILAKWYKETIQNGLLDAVYTNKKKIDGVNLGDPTIKEQIYRRYLQAYKKGVFNYIKEDPTPDGQMPRKYFSGGTFLGNYTVRGDGAMSAVKADGAMIGLTVALVTAGTAALGTGNPDAAMVGVQWILLRYKGPQLESRLEMYFARQRYGDLVRFLHHGNYIVLLKAIEALGKLGNKKAIGPLLGSLYGGGVDYLHSDNMFNGVHTNILLALQQLDASPYDFLKGYLNVFASLNSRPIDGQRGFDYGHKSIYLSVKSALYALEEMGNASNVKIPANLLGSHGFNKMFIKYTFYGSAPDDWAKIKSSNLRLIFAKAILAVMGDEYIDVIKLLLERQPPDAQNDLLSDFYDAIRYRKEGDDFRVVFQPEKSRQVLVGTSYDGDHYETVVDTPEDLKIERGDKLDGAMITLKSYDRTEGEKLEIPIAELREATHLSIYFERARQNFPYEVKDGELYYNDQEIDEIGLSLTYQGNKKVKVQKSKVGYLITIDPSENKKPGRVVIKVLKSDAVPVKVYDLNGNTTDSVIPFNHTLKAIWRARQGIPGLYKDDPQDYQRRYVGGLRLAFNKHKPITADENPNLEGPVIRPYQEGQFTFGEKADIRTRLMVIDLNGTSINILANNNPLLPYQFMLIPDMERKLVQDIRQQDIEATLELLKISGDEHLKFTHNSWKAASSVNNLHIHGFYYDDTRLPIEQAKTTIVKDFGNWKISKLIDFPAQAFVFEGDNKEIAQASRNVVENLQKQNIAYNILITLNKAYVIPRAQEAVDIEGKYYKFGYSAMSGELLLPTQKAYDSFTEKQAAEAIAKASVSPQRFEALEKDLLRNNAQLTMPFTQENGGIDLNQISIKRTGKTISMRFDPAQLTQLEQGGFEGFTPVIINMTRISSPFRLLGVKQPAKELELLAKV